MNGLIRMTLAVFAVAAGSVAYTNAANAAPIINAIYTTYSSTGVPISITVSGTGLCTTTTCTTKPTIKLGGITLAGVTGTSNTGVSANLGLISDGDYLLTLTAGTTVTTNTTTSFPLAVRAKTAASSGATITVGTTTTGAAGTNASVSNTGTTTAPVLNFTVPQGAAGSAGINGLPGGKGEKGDKGDPGTGGAGAVVTAASLAACPNGGATVSDGTGAQASACNGAVGPTGPSGYNGPLVVDSTGKVVGPYLWMRDALSNPNYPGDHVLVRSQSGTFLMSFAEKQIGDPLDNWVGGPFKGVYFPSSDCTGTGYMNAYTVSALATGVVINSKVYILPKFSLPPAGFYESAFSKLGQDGVCVPITWPPSGENLSAGTGYIFLPVTVIPYADFGFTPPFSIQ